MKLTTAQVYEVSVTLNALEKMDVIFAPEVSLKIAIMFDKLRQISAAYEKTRARIVPAILENKENLPNAKLQEKIAESERELLDTVVDVDIEKIHKDDLGLDSNKINPITLARLLPILDGVTH